VKPQVLVYFRVHNIIFFRLAELSEAETQYQKSDDCFAEFSEMPGRNFMCMQSWSFFDQFAVH